VVEGVFAVGEIAGDELEVVVVENKVVVDYVAVD